MTEEQIKALVNYMDCAAYFFSRVAYTNCLPEEADRAAIEVREKENKMRKAFGLKKKYKRSKSNG